MQITEKTGKRAMKKDRRTDLRKKMVLPAAMMRSFVMGFKGSITNLFILDIAMEFGRSMSELGGMIAANYIAGVIVPFIAGRASDLIGKKKVIMISMIIAAAGALMIAFSESVGVYIIGTIVLGIGNTASNGAITPALADMFPKKATRYISHDGSSHDPSFPARQARGDLEICSYRHSGADFYSVLNDSHVGYTGA